MEVNFSQHLPITRVRNREVSEDLVQETFLAGVKSQERFKGQPSEKTWLFGILKHKVIDHFWKNRTIVYREIDGMSTEEICTLFDITSANCWVILYRARMLLRKCLELVGFHSPQAAEQKEPG